MSFGDPCDDVIELTEADACELTYEELFAELKRCEHRNALLRIEIEGLRAELARLPPMRPTPLELEW